MQTFFISGAGRSNEGAGEEQPDEEAVHLGAQGGGQAGEGGGAAEPAGGPAGAAGGADTEDRPRAVPVPVLQLVPVIVRNTSKIQT